MNKMNQKLIKYLSVANSIAAPFIVIGSTVWILEVLGASFVRVLLGLFIGFVAAIFTCGPIAVLISIKESLEDINGKLSDSNSVEKV